MRNEPIQDEYYCRWNFPNCCGALDGKYVIRNVDANYCFRFIDVGTNGQANNAAVFAKLSFNAALQANMLGFPKNGLFVADDAFQELQIWFEHHRLNNGILK